MMSADRWVIRAIWRRPTSPWDPHPWTQVARPTAAVNVLNIRYISCPSGLATYLLVRCNQIWNLIYSYIIYILLRDKYTLHLMCLSQFSTGGNIFNLRPNCKILNINRIPDRIRSTINCLSTKSEATILCRIRSGRTLQIHICHYWTAKILSSRPLQHILYLIVRTRRNNPQTLTGLILSSSSYLSRRNRRVIINITLNCKCLSWCSNRPESNNSPRTYYSVVIINRGHLIKI